MHYETDRIRVYIHFVCKKGEGDSIEGGRDGYKPLWFQDTIPKVTRGCLWITHEDNTITNLKTSTYDVTVPFSDGIKKGFISL